MSCDLPQTPLAMSLIRPTWADPRYMLAVNDTRITTVVVPQMTPTLVIGANPRRWAIGFLTEIAYTKSIHFGPWPDPPNYAWLLTNRQEPFWFSLIDYGTMVCREWWAYSPGDANIRVVESIIN